MTSTEPGDADDAAANKLIPEWGVDADDQVILAGVAAFLVLLLVLGWNAWRSDDGDVATPTTVASTTTAVAGIERVDNNLVLLDGAVVDALTAAGVVSATAAGAGTELTVGGLIQSEDDRQAVLDAAAVEGVTSIEDQLEVSVAADLNALPQVQFATGSAEILATSFVDLRAAAGLVRSAGDVRLMVVGWTDTRGDDDDNLALSQARADAVVAYLVAAGVSEATFTSIGSGETDQFAEGDTPEALQANRVVLFEQTG